ncbi:MAG: hypothetical protein KDB03_23170, partial [Planctomycetales bacterium]|nr:hypothetical protein [Planctomycetales bacterium]
MLQHNTLANDFPAMHLVHTGRVVRRIGNVALALLVTGLIGMLLVPWRQTARGYGEVVALDPQERSQAVLCPSKGIVDYVKPGLREGSHVEQGELLLRLVPFASEAVSQLESQIALIDSKKIAAESSLTVSEQAAQIQGNVGLNLIASLNQDYQAARQKWEQAKNEVAVVQAELVDVRNQLRIAEEVLPRGLVSVEEVVSKRQKAEAQANKLLKAENYVDEAFASLLSKEDEIEAKKQEIDIKNRSANQKVLEDLQKLSSIEKELIDLQNK